MKKDTLYIPSLDGIRAAAVLLVFSAHAGLNERVPGNFGVTVFFFLSGYLITSLLRIEFDRTGRISLRDFYLRRVLRIFPPFYLVLVGASTLCFFGWLEGFLTPDALLAQMFNLSNYYIIGNGWWDGRAPGTWVYWSLAVEEHFYLFFPVVYLLLRRYLPSRRKQALVLLGLCLAVLAWRCVLVFGLDVAKDRTYVASDTRVDSILWGCALAVYANPVLDAVRIAERWLKFFWVPLGLVGLLLSFLARDQRIEESIRYTLQGLALVPLFIAAIQYPNWGPFRILNVSWVKFIGLLSYSMYLLHPTVMYAVHQYTVWHPFAQGVTSLALTIAIALAIHYGVEKRCAYLRRKLSSADRRSVFHSAPLGTQGVQMRPAPIP